MITIPDEGILNMNYVEEVDGGILEIRLYGYPTGYMRDKIETMLGKLTEETDGRWSQGPIYQASDLPQL